MSEVWLVYGKVRTLQNTKYHQVRVIHHGDSQSFLRILAAIQDGCRPTWLTTYLLLKIDPNLVVFGFWCKPISWTRMHSSRMRTVRSCSHLPRGGCAWSQGGVPGPGGSALGSAWSWGSVCSGGWWWWWYPNMHWGRPPPCEQTDWQTGVKT